MERESEKSHATKFSFWFENFSFPAQEKNILRATF